MQALLWILLLAQTQGGVISGRIVSNDGTPAAQKRIVAQAVLERADVALGAAMLAGLSQTDNDGRFRLENIPPGRYYIVLDPLDVPSYYPGVTKPERATIVTVSDASAIEGMDFKIPDFEGGKVFGHLAPPPLPLSSGIQVNLVTNPNLSGLTGASVIQSLLNLGPNTVTALNISLGMTSLNPLQVVSASVDADGS
ncbi:MAG TPA: carboxypeptidase-like regulatory domain-containing protein, partial [Terriglobia bacterium]|nr:carboxypeptidase-like regulatory domain-containing protein [Terriglobia bacterium]